MAALANKLCWLWPGVSLGLSLFALFLGGGGPSKKVVMLQALWSGLGLVTFAFASSLSSNKAAMAAWLHPMLGHAAAAPSKKTAPAWPDLPPELLGLVLSRVPSRADRIRIRAVCRLWRRSGAQSLPPLLPWFALRDGTFLSLPDGAIYRMPAVPNYGSNVLYRLSTGSMLFIMDDNGGCSLMNPCSGKTTRLQMNLGHLKLRYLWGIRKVVVSDDLRTVAILTVEKTNLKNVTVYALQGSLTSTVVMEWAPPINNVAIDIAFFRGELYVLTRGEEVDDRLPELHVLQLLEEPEEAGNDIRSNQCITIMHEDDGLNHFCFYLVVSGDRLLMVGRVVFPDPKDSPMPSRCFKAFEAAGLRSGHGWWSKVEDTLMGHALFVSQGCCRSLAPAVGRNGGVSGGTGAQEDCIYFMSEPPSVSSVDRDFVDSCVYNVRDGTVSHLPLERQATLSSLTAWGVWFPTWFFPAEEDDVVVVI